MTRTLLNHRMSQTPRPLTIAIYLYADMEALDFSGPYEVFTTANRMALRLDPDGIAPFHVVTVADTLAPVRARAGMRVLPDHDPTSCPLADILLVPGGVVDVPLSRADSIDWIRRCAGHAQITASVCTGAFLLAAAGLLDGLTATTHWEDIDDLRTHYPDVDVVDDLRWVDTGAVVTSAGIAAGIDMSLHLVARLCGEVLAAKTARQMDVAYRPDPRIVTT